ncbi:MAG: DUF3050 domain-containing protein, partial [Candidatus Thiodiazotropha sp.]
RLRHVGFPVSPRDYRGLTASAFSLPWRSALVKRLQRELTCIELPWLPPRHNLAARLINDIVLGEETDLAPEGHLSHYELYLDAMREVGADTGPVEDFIGRLCAGQSFEDAIQHPDIPPPVRSFVSHTLYTAKNGDFGEVLGNFFFGRENVIPKMFETLLKSWELEEQDAPVFVFYLKRHIELDTESHGPAALRMIKELVGQDLSAMQRLGMSAGAAIEARKALWDALADTLKWQNMKSQPDLCSVPHRPPSNA